MPSTIPVIERMDQRVAELTNHFYSYVKVFDASDRFSGPSLYFHRRTIEQRRSAVSVAGVVASIEFVELLYATLTAWGMHRMGPGNTKLREFKDFHGSLEESLPKLRGLEELVLSSLSDDQLGEATEALTELIVTMQLSQADAKIVVNSKALHHLLPDLVPPIDREYTYQFFYNRKNLSIPERDAFREMFTRFQRVAKQKSQVFGQVDQSGWNTSETKLLDNAIVGYSLETLRA